MVKKNIGPPLLAPAGQNKTRVHPVLSLPDKFIEEDSFVTKLSSLRNGKAYDGLRESGAPTPEVRIPVRYHSSPVLK